ncbi:MAG: DPP IV N-terminal domain-containing protein [Bryobacteraceae bacterium]
MRTLLGTLLYASFLLQPLAAQRKPVSRKPVSMDALNEWRSNAFGRMRQAPSDPVWAPDGLSFAYRQENWLRRYDAATGASREIIQLPTLNAAGVAPVEPARMLWENRRVDEAQVQWFPSGDRLLISAQSDLFVVDATGGKWKQLTRTNAAERDAKLSPDGTRVAFLKDWDIYVTEIATGKQTRLTNGGTEMVRNGVLDWVYPEELRLGTAYWWAPDGSAIAYLQFDITGESRYPHVDLRGAKAVTEAQAYPQAGDDNARVRLGVVPTLGGAVGKTRWLDVGDTVKSYLIARAGWAPDSHKVWVARTNRVQNKLEMLMFDTTTGKSNVIYREEDPYWINVEGDPIFLPDSTGFLWTNERNNHRHLYSYGMNGGKPRQLTEGSSEVSSIACVDAKRGRVFYVKSRPTPLDRQLEEINYRDPSDSPHVITKTTGTRRISMGPGCLYYLDNRSDVSTPSQTTVHSSDGAQTAVYREMDRSSLDNYDLRPVELVSFEANGTRFYGTLIKPAGFDPAKKYPLIVNVYGGPHAQDVRNAWDGMNLDQVYAQSGYVIWQMDNRGTQGRGHEFEAPVYRKLGEIEMADQRAGVEYLLSLGFIDKNRIGVRGWSYGGFMAANLLLRAGDLFHAGFAGAPVTNWRNYDTIYTERYMDLPEENAEGYRSTALAQYAAQLRGRLMIVHNIEDDNVLFQNTVQLAEALQIAGKQFELMVYPQKSHGVGGLAARQMERAEFEFFERNLKAAVQDNSAAR